MDEQVPMDTTPRPCARHTALKKSTLQLNATTTNCNCGESAVPPAFGVAHNRHANDSEDLWEHNEVLNELELWEHDCLLHSLHLRNPHEPHSRDVEHLVEKQLGNLHDQLKAWIMGNSLCVATGMSTT